MALALAARLIGFTNPVGLAPAFCIPICQLARGNETLAQVVATDNTVVRFQRIEVPRSALRETVERVVVSPGQPAVWVFEFADGSHIVGDRISISPILARRRSEFRDTPLLDLQVLRFIGDRSKINQALRRANIYLKNISPSTAQLWRDLVVIPPVVREAMYSSFDEEDRGRFASSLAEIDVFVTNGKVSIEVPAAARSAIRANRALASAVERGLERIAAILNQAPLVYSGLGDQFRHAPDPAKAYPPPKSDADTDALTDLEEARALFARRNLATAELFAQRALNNFAAQDAHPLVGEAARLLAEIQAAQGRFDSALKLLDQALGAFKEQGSKIDYLVCRLTQLSHWTEK